MKASSTRWVWTACLAMLLLLGGCALLDQLVGTTERQLADEQGRPLYLDARGLPTPEPHDAAGEAHQPLTITLVREDAPFDASALGPWGALLGGLATLGAGIYARGRNRRALRDTEQRLDLTASALAFAVRLVEKIKEGRAIPTDAQGRVRLADVKAWVRERGGGFDDPRFLAEVVRIANAALPTTDERRLLKTTGASASGPRFAK